MEWREEGTVLRRRAHGERSVILDVLTATRGRWSGVVPGGAGGRRAALLQPGARLMLHWRARLDDQLGTFAIEPVASRAALLADPLALAGLNAVTALLVFALPERDPHPRLAAATEALLDAMTAGAEWPEGYLHWEMLLLDEMGFGLDLTACAVTGATDGLAYVSPASGRAVTVAGAGDYAARLLPLPAILAGRASNDARGDLAAGLALTGHFLETRLAAQLVGRPLPAARARLVARLADAAASPPAL